MHVYDVTISGHSSKSEYKLISHWSKWSRALVLPGWYFLRWKIHRSDFSRLDVLLDSYVVLLRLRYHTEERVHEHIRSGNKKIKYRPHRRNSKVSLNGKFDNIRQCF